MLRRERQRRGNVARERDGQKTKRWSYTGGDEVKQKGARRGRQIAQTPHSRLLRLGTKRSPHDILSPDTYKG